MRKCNYSGRKLPIPSHLSTTKSFEEEEVIAISDAQQSFDECPKCKSEFPFGTLDFSDREF